MRQAGIGMSEHQLTDKEDVRQVVTAVLNELGRSDTPYSYGVAVDRETAEQILYFDLPRVSPLQFNIKIGSLTTQKQLLERVKEAIMERLKAE